MGLFSFINRKKREIKNDDTKFVFDTVIESPEEKKETQPINKNNSKVLSKTTQFKEENDKLSSIQLECIDKYKTQTISVLSIPQSLFDKNFCEAVVRINAHAIAFIPKEFVPLELCKIAVEINPLVIKNIPADLREQIIDYKKLEELSEDFRKEKDKTLIELMEECIPGYEITFAPDSGLHNEGGSLADQFEYYREHSDQFEYYREHPL